MLIQLEVTNQLVSAVDAFIHSDTSGSMIPAMTTKDSAIAPAAPVEGTDSNMILFSIAGHGSRAVGTTEKQTVCSVHRTFFFRKSGLTVATYKNSAMAEVLVSFCGRNGGPTILAIIDRTLGPVIGSLCQEIWFVAIVA